MGRSIRSRYEWQSSPNRGSDIVESAFYHLAFGTGDDLPKGRKDIGMGFEKVGSKALVVHQGPCEDHELQQVDRILAVQRGVEVVLLLGVG